MSDENTLDIEYKRDVEPVIRQYLKDLKYGYITLVVQDGKVIQVERNEKTRLK